MVILGSTGSIGVNALRVLKALDSKIEAISCNSNTTLLNEQIKEFNPDFICINENYKDLVNFPTNKIFFDVQDLLKSCKSQHILNAIVGFAGLKASLITQELGKNLLLANKESLVVGGDLLQAVNIFPIDSEHFSLWYLLRGRRNFKKLIITASGGALRDYRAEDMQNVTIEDVLQHPNWKMGRQITIDSATLVNKLYELIEAYHLFKTKDITAIIERGSLVHSLVEFNDGCINANFSKPDMTLPLSYAIGQALGVDALSIINNLDSKKHNIASILNKRLSLQDLATINFQEIDIKLFPLWKYKDILLEKPHLGIVLNYSNEYLVKLFLESKVRFVDISLYISKCLEEFIDIKKILSYEEILVLQKEIINFLTFSLHIK